MRQILGWSAGGVHKRIDENRELLELLQREAPDLLKRHYWIESWINSNDEFFNELAVAVPISEGRFLNYVKSWGSPFPRDWPIEPDASRTVWNRNEEECTARQWHSLVSNLRTSP